MQKYFKYKYKYFWEKVFKIQYIILFMYFKLMYLKQYFKYLYLKYSPALLRLPQQIDYKIVVMAF